jgi:phage pi2 protein 07
MPKALHPDNQLFSTKEMMLLVEASFKEKNKMRLYQLFICAVFLISTASCNKSTEVLNTKSIQTFMPLEIGKYILYNLDSTVYTNLGTKIEIRSYQIKDTIQTVTTDNLGRKVFRISRLLRSNTDSNNWKNIFTYNAILDSTKLEIIESNQRYLKLMLPIKEGFNWKGNTYVNTVSSPDLQFLNNWEYRYLDVDKSITINNVRFNNTISVLQRNDTINNPSNKNVLSEINYSKEIFAENIGLVFKEFKHQVWQPPNANSNSGYYEENCLS